jgi:crotonobetainyl-CoA:carnitine CoA-transferase CaiB-like acyl-CoA transferase
MTTKPLEGIRVVEAAQFTFVPGAGAILAEWGATVIKIEHPVTGDPQRGFAVDGTSATGTSFAPIMEHANSGKRSIGLALDRPEGLDVLYRLVRASDVFSTNYLPSARRRLRIDVEDIQAQNPDIVYARGSALGVRGAEAHKGGYDQGAFWCRGGSSAGVTPAGLGGMLGQPGPAFGDSLGAIAIAGGVCAALLGRGRGGGSVVDVSLLGLGAWANGLSVASALLTGKSSSPPAVGAGFVPGNPLAGMYETSDGRWIQLSMLQPGRYWASLCDVLERADLRADPRFAEVGALLANAADATRQLRGEFASRPLAEWRARLASFDGQWEVVQSSYEVGTDPQLVANGNVAHVLDAGGESHELITSPVQFDETPAELVRSPTFAEHGHEILRELGLDDDAILELQLAGVVV